MPAPRRGHAAAVAAALLAALATACAVPGGGGLSVNGRGSHGPTPGPAGPAVRIGVVTDLSGPDARLGESQRRGAEVAVKQLGGRAGDHRLTLTVRDDQGRPETAAARARELVQADHVDFLTGCVSSATGVAVNQAARQAGIPYIGTCESDQLDRPPDLGPTTFSLAPLPSQVAGAVTPWVVGNLGAHLLFLEPDVPSGHQQYEAFRRAVPAAGGVLEGVIWSPPGTTDYTPYLPIVLAAHADVLVVGVQGHELTSFLKQARQFGVERKLKVFQLLADAALDDEVGFDAVAGTYAATSYAWSAADADGSRFAHDYQAAYGPPPGSAAAAAHDAVTLIGRQVAAGRSRPADFAQAVSGQPVGLSGGAGYIRACDHQAFQPTHVLQGLTQAEAGARGGSARYGYRATLATIPVDERQGPSCADLGLG
jgi:ABC-type branched-subunit amino acid transport system substrate-binding protein